jgi:hypothetical protein
MRKRWLTFCEGVGFCLGYLYGFFLKPLPPDKRDNLRRRR